VSEACSNAVLHSGTDVVRIVWTFRRDCVRIRVEDDGVFRRAMAAPQESGGRGILVMMAVMDEVAVREGTERHPGTTVRLVRCRGR
jgi:anti-sigma regulatory factor (Ser/Thr protein kinase)